MEMCSPLKHGVDQYNNPDNADAYVATLGGARRRFTPRFYSIPRACFQRLKLKYDNLHSIVGFNCRLRHYSWGRRYGGKHPAE